VPLISVIIPAFNSAKTIKRTIDSVLVQTLTDFELIIINDASTDNTLDIISQYQDPRLQILSYPHGGGNISRNRGLKHALGEYVSFLDADDMWESDKLESQLKVLQQNTEVAIAYSWTDYINEEDNVILKGSHTTANGNIYEKLLVHNFLENGSNPLIRKTSIVELGGFDETLTAGQDWDMWLRLAQKHHFICIPKVHILYRVSTNSLSNNLDRQEQACLKVLEKALQSSPPSLHHLRTQSLANLYKYLTCKALQKPLNRQKGLTAAKFLWKFVKNDAFRAKRASLTFKMFVKIVMILFLPGELANILLKK
jgi:glycosyltransferase involved in cell wall biosynthesis